MAVQQQAHRESRVLRALVGATYLLLLAIPLGYVSKALGWGTLATFALFALAIIPLAGLTAIFSDVLVERTTPRGDTSGRLTWGGAVGAILDNLSFIILGIAALSQGLTQVVQASIAGAIISNTLLVLGLAFFFGAGLGKRRQIFNGDKAKDYAKLLAVIVTAFVLLAFVEAADPKQQNIGSGMSIFIAITFLVLLFASYVAYEFFHWRRFEEEEKKAKEAKLAELADDGPFVEGMNSLLRSHGAGYELQRQTGAPVDGARLVQGINTLLGERQAGYELRLMEERAPATRRSRIPLIVALLGLVAVLVATFFVSTELAQLTTSITSGAFPISIAGIDLGSITLSQAFVGLVIIPVIGSAAEHLNSIRNAVRGNTEAAVNNTAGYAIQITLLAAPILVLVSAILFPDHAFSFDFTPIELAIFGAATFIFYAVTEDGEGTVVEGAALLAVYAIFAVGTLFLP
jgi:Ca2+:H+ antiporter